MKIEIPKPQLREDGEFAVYVTKGYGDPHGTIALDEQWELTLNYVSAEDCDRLIRMAAEIKEKVLAYRAELAGPHGRKHLHKGRCQLCGKPAAHSLHDVAYRLACGCTDGRGCTCAGCQDCKTHKPGETWHCDEHGTTSIASVEHPEPEPADHPDEADGFASAELRGSLA